MKKWKFNKNIILFIACFAFIIFGFSSSPVRENLKVAVLGFINKEFTVDVTKNRINNTLDKNLAYHAQLLNLNGLRENLLGTRVIKKDIYVVKSDSGSIIGPVEKIEKADLQKTVSIIKELHLASEKNGAKFLYCAAPSKELYETAPANVENHFEENYQGFLNELEIAKVPTIDFSQALEENLAKDERFYYTDHHWTVRSGFVANNALLEELNSRYGFEYDKEKTDIKNYKVKKYSNYFLGSKGKKVGTGFTWHGADDFEVISPKFKTRFIEEQPFKKQVRKGYFKKTVFYKKHLKKDYYTVNPYAAYSGGDFRLQIMTNELNTEGKKVLLVRDSFACVVAPFLALQTKELHVCDVRAGGGYVGEKLNMKEYIKKIKPDYVLVLYNGVLKASDTRHDFF